MREGLGADFCVLITMVSGPTSGARGSSVASSTWNDLTARITASTGPTPASSGSVATVMSAAGTSKTSSSSTAR